MKKLIYLIKTSLITAVIGLFSGLLLGIVIWSIMSLLSSGGPFNNRDFPIEFITFFGMSFGTIIGAVFGGMVGLKGR